MTRPPRSVEAPDEPRLATLRIEKLVGGGRGLAHLDGLTWLVSGGLPGEQVTATVHGRRAGVVEATASAVIGPAHPARLADPCPHADLCGGCDWPHVHPESDARLKAMVAAEAAAHSPELAARLAEAPVRLSPLGYRLRARLHWQPDRQTLGFYAPRTWQANPIPSCRILSPRLMSALAQIRAALARTCPEPVDVEWLEDLDGAHAVAALRPSRNGPPTIDPRWVPGEPLMDGAVDGCHALTQSGQLVARWGLDSVTMRVPVPLEVPIGAFFQSNRHLVRWLFRRVEQLVGPRPAPTWDLHAGVGFLAAAAHAAARRPLELVEAYRPSARAAQRNLPSARVATGRTVEAYLSRARDLPASALVLTDPPRAGMSPQLRHRLAGWRPERILTLGCDPATWARDAAFLIERGYRLAHLELVDMFPSTHHIEVLALLEIG